jgi:hypothetical protein
VCAQIQTILSVIVLVVEVTMRVVRRILLLLLGLLHLHQKCDNDELHSLQLTVPATHVAPTAKRIKQQQQQHYQESMNEPLLSVPFEHFESGDVLTRDLIDMALPSRLAELITLACQRRSSLFVGHPMSTEEASITTSDLAASDRRRWSAASEVATPLSPQQQQKQGALLQKLASQKREREELLQRLSLLRQQQQSTSISAANQNVELIMQE